MRAQRAGGETLSRVRHSQLVVALRLDQIHKLNATRNDSDIANITRCNEFGDSLMTAENAANKVPASEPQRRTRHVEF
jgi:hypothetical protein